MKHTIIRVFFNLARKLFLKNYVQEVCEVLNLQIDAIFSHVSYHSLSDII